MDTLYKRAANGSIRAWTVWTEGNRVIRSSGQFGGVSTEAFDDAEGKNIGRANETTPEEQADLMARSYWNKKKDEGYKTLEELGIHGEANFFVLNSRLPAFNTDAQGNIKPMLAKAVEWSSVAYPCFVQPKLDGVRCLMLVDEDSVQFISRSGKPYTTLGHIESDVLGGIDNFILDGEVYSEELTFQEIMSAVKKLGLNSTKLHFRAYDVVNASDMKARLKEVSRIVQGIRSPFVSMVDTRVVENAQQVKELHDKWVQEGYEGAMIRYMYGKYQQGVRSSGLRKVKEFDDEEFECIGLISGKRDEDLIALCRTKDGASFKAKLVGTREYKQELESKWDGRTRQLTVKFFGWTTDKLPRFPIGKAFRDA